MNVQLRVPSREAATEPVRGALFALGFRPFFILAAMHAVVFVPLWLLVLFGKVSLPLRHAGPSWHGHEMIFGFSIAVIAGFLLTAVRNWTNKPTPTGARLVGLVVLWALGRIACATEGLFPSALVAAVDVAFVPVLAASVAFPIVAAKNVRNLGFVVLLVLLTCANVVFHASPAHATQALRVALNLVLVMIVLIGGRVIPSFTSNATRAQIPQRPLVDRAAIATTALVVLAEMAPPPVLGVACLIAGVANGVRLAGWKSIATRKMPILWSLHVGYAWLAVGLVLRGLTTLVPFGVPNAALHALGVGAVAMLILAMMSRVSLGHTGRMLVVGSAVTVAYGALVVAAVVRVFGPLVVPSAYAWALVISAGAWALAFVLFLVVYVPILRAPRVDGKPG